MNSIHLILIASAALAGCVAGVPQREEASKVPTMTTLPKDIYPESRSRLPLPKREALDEQGKRVYDSVLDPKRPTIAGFQGPAGIWLHSPRVGEPFREMNRILRTEVSLEARLRELAILVAAREFDSQFEWTAHEPVALKEGLDPKVLDTVKFRRPVYAEMVRVFGQTAVVNITALMANYAFTAVMLTAFDQQLHEGRKPLLPLP